jgi:RNA polymerase sigma-70 factor (ECF subfamily)
MAPSAEQCSELVAAIQDGDRQAEGRLVELFGRGIMLLLDRHTNGRPEAEDLFQDTFRIALEKVRGGELREPGKLPGFLSRLARNLAIEYYRKAARRKTDTAGHDLPEVADAAQEALDWLIEREDAHAVRRLLDELRNARDRELLLRYYLAEEDKDLLAADLGLTGSQLNRVLYRARQRYKALYISYRGGSGDAVIAIVFLVPRF